MSKHTTNQRMRKVDVKLVLLHSIQTLFGIESSHAPASQPGGVRLLCGALPPAGRGRGGSVEAWHVTSLCPATSRSRGNIVVGIVPVHTPRHVLAWERGCPALRRTGAGIVPVLPGEKGTRKTELSPRSEQLLHIFHLQISRLSRILYAFFS